MFFMFFVYYLEVKVIYKKDKLDLRLNRMLFSEEFIFVFGIYKNIMCE